MTAETEPVTAFAPAGALGVRVLLLRFVSRHSAGMLLLLVFGAEVGLGMFVARDLLTT